eukprot:Gb_32625 [translate_table: standard]
MGHGIKLKEAEKGSNGFTLVNALQSHMPRPKEVLGEIFQSMKMKGPKWDYMRMPIYLFCLFAFIFCFSRAQDIFALVGLEDVHELWQTLQKNHNTLIVLFWMVACVALICYMSRRRRVYMMDFACYKPADERKCTFEIAEYFVERSEKFSHETMEFQRRIYNNSGLGDETYIPPFIFKENHEEITLESAWEETREVMLGAADEIMHKTGVHADDIGIVVTTCSMFNPAPSLASMIINRYKMKEDVKCVHLGGMGCSSGVIAVDLAAQLLKCAKKNTYALVVITENITLNWYMGNNRSMLVTNCLFRVGCAAVILSNNPRDRCRAKSELVHSVRTHIGANDKAYRAAFQEEDEDGNLGIALKKDLIPVAGEGLRTHIRSLGPLVLPYLEQLFFLLSLVGRKVFKMDIKPYTPDFTLAFEHFCIHTGGKAVINEISRFLRLNDYLLEPARMVLQRFGNTSSSLVFYELAYMEAQNRIKKGDRIWMIAFGTGFKCNSIVWKALDDWNEPVCNPWLDCIHRYPVEFR